MTGLQGWLANEDLTFNDAVAHLPSAQWPAACERPTSDTRLSALNWRSTPTGGRGLVTELALVPGRLER